MANEKRLIEVAPLIDECKECMNIEWNKSVYTTWAEAEEDFMQRLLDAPTVEATPVVHGRWEQGDFYDCGDVCSICDWDCAIDDCHWSYCPNCGAKMDGDGND